jgi:hypothetical protein
MYFLFFFSPLYVSLSSSLSSSLSPPLSPSLPLSLSPLSLSLYLFFKNIQIVSPLFCFSHNHRNGLGVSQDVKKLFAHIIIAKKHLKGKVKFTLI